LEVWLALLLPHPAKIKDNISGGLLLGQLMKVLFVYHAEQGSHKHVTKFHFNLLRKFDGDIVLPIADKVDYLPNTWVGDKHKKYVPRGHPWAMSDSLVYNFALQNDLKNDVYAIVEWDTYCSISIKEHFKDFLDKPLSGWRLVTNHDWCWIKNKDRPGACGIVPFSCVIIQRDVLLQASNAIAENSHWHNFDNNEARLGTIAREIGIPISTYEGKIDTIQPFEQNVLPEPGVYHSVKKLIFPKT
jgi:hypothetical protein